jgi:hypothetical protein
MALDKSLKPKTRCSSTSTSNGDKPARTESPGAGLPPVSYPQSLPRSSNPQSLLSCRRSGSRARSQSLSARRHRLTAVAGLRARHAGGSGRGAGNASPPGGQRVLQARGEDHQTTGAQAGVGRLKPFGYELFKDSVASFAPATTFRCPRNTSSWRSAYRSAVRQSESHAAASVGRDGRVNFPELGPINVGGQTSCASRRTSSSALSAR